MDARAKEGLHTPVHGADSVGGGGKQPWKSQPHGAASKFSGATHIPANPSFLSVPALPMWALQDVAQLGERFPVVSLASALPSCI